MTDNQLSKFIEQGGIEKIGQASFTLLSLIVNKAKTLGYPKQIDISVREIMYKCKFRGHNQLKLARDTLIENGCIKDYQNPNHLDSGTFFLKYD